MSTIREKSPGSRPAWHYLFVFIVIILWLAACGGGGSGPNEAAPVVVVPPPQTCAVDPGVKHDCPTGAICVGYVTGTSVGNIFPVAIGNRPDWSPDGQQIVFHREGTVYIVNADGSGESELVPGSEPAWSPGPGNLIAFTSAEGVAVVNRDGSNYRTLASNDRGNAISLSAPSWAPDGQWIAYAQLQGTEQRGSSQIYAMPVGGSESFRLTALNPLTSFERDPSWSPDGSIIAFTTPELAIVDSDYYAHKWQLGRASRPDWSPDGSVIAFSIFDQCAPGERKISVINRFGAEATTLLVNALQPAWSPDGARIAFAASAEPPGNAAFPSVTQPARIYLRETASSFDSVSRFVLYEDNMFELQYVTPRAGFFTYTGSYTQNSSDLLFNFHASSKAGPWNARGLLDGDRLSVSFNIVMGLADFEDGIYVLTETWGLD